MNSIDALCIECLKEGRKKPLRLLIGNISTCDACARQEHSQITGQATGGQVPLYQRARSNINIVIHNDAGIMDNNAGVTPNKPVPQPPLIILLIFTLLLLLSGCSLVPSGTTNKPTGTPTT